MWGNLLHFGIDISAVLWSDNNMGFTDRHRMNEILFDKVSIFIQEWKGTKMWPPSGDIQELQWCVSRHLYSLIRYSTGNMRKVSLLGARPYHLFRWAIASPLHILASLFWPLCRGTVFGSSVGLTYHSLTRSSGPLMRQLREFLLVRVHMQDWPLISLTASATLAIACRALK